MDIDDLRQLDGLLNASKHRAFHIASLVIGVLVLITSQINWVAPNPRVLMNIIVWCLGCFGIALFMLFWVRGRVLATIRLKNLVHYNSLEVQDADVTHFRFFGVVPFGYEVGVNLVSGEHLAFGFWSEQSAYHLHELLQEAHRLAAQSKQITGLETH